MTTDPSIASDRIHYTYTHNYPENSTLLVDGHPRRLERHPNDVSAPREPRNAGPGPLVFQKDGAAVCGDGFQELGYLARTGRAEQEQGFAAVAAVERDPGGED